MTETTKTSGKCNCFQDSAIRSQSDLLELESEGSSSALTCWFCSLAGCFFLLPLVSLHNITPVTLRQLPAAASYFLLFLLKISSDKTPQEQHSFGASLCVGFTGKDVFAGLKVDGFLFLYSLVIMFSRGQRVI